MRKFHLPVMMTHCDVTTSCCHCCRVAVRRRRLWKRNSIVVCSRSSQKQHLPSSHGWEAWVKCTCTLHEYSTWFLINSASFQFIGDFKDLTMPLEKLSAAALAELGFFLEIFQKKNYSLTTWTITVSCFIYSFLKERPTARNRSRFGLNSFKNTATSCRKSHNK